MRPFQDPKVKLVFDAYPAHIRKKLLALRELIFDVAAETKSIGKLEETLKWGEPAYLTPETGSGSTVRIDWKKTRPDQYAMYFHCQTNLVEMFRAQFPGELQFEGNRAIVFHEHESIALEAVAQCVQASLTYHLAKARQRRASKNRKARHAARTR